MSKIDNPTRLKHMKDAAVEARGFIAGCDRSVTLSGWLLGFCIIRDRDRIFVNINLKCRVG